MNTTKVEIIRTSGRREQHTVPVDRLMQWVHRAIDAETLDTVSLRDGRVMMLDDKGYESELVELEPGHSELRPIRAVKPENAEATKLYHAICIPGTEHKIVGDVAIVIDREVE